MLWDLLRGLGVGGLALSSITSGAIWATVRRPAVITKSVIQHLAAGTVFAGLVADVLAKLLARSRSPVWVALGMAAGLSVMLAIRYTVQRQEEQPGGGASTLGATIVVDVSVDGLLLGISIATGGPVAIIFAVALAPELFFLGATASEDFGGDGRDRLRAIGIPAAVGGAALVAALGGAALERTAPDVVLTAVLAFGAIALAYLVTEELLREAHEQRAEPWIAAMFFAGFMPFFVAAVAAR